MLQSILFTTQIDGLMFGKEIHPGSYLITTFLTLLFMGIVNIAMIKPISKIDMVESLKSVD